MARLFGTDGVRGRANQTPMTPETALALGRAAGAVFGRSASEKRAVIGKDTRLSGYMLESALQAGLTSSGMNVFLLGPVPTPAVGLLTRSMRADVGVMISASHNPYEDNGIKLFGPDGFKLSDSLEDEIAEAAAGDPPRALADRIGRARRIDGGLARYVEFVKGVFPRALRLDGMKIVVDCANGAAYRAAPQVLWELGAEVIPIGVSPDGCNINDACGSTAPAACRKAVLETGADLGIALDGDADRVILVDERGRLVDGDQLLALVTDRLAASGAVSGRGVVGTLMTNLGFERWLEARNLALERADVGDRHVVSRMRALGRNVGGEPSGHVILTDLTTTGDGLVAALQALAAMAESDEPASALLHLFEPTSQLLRNLQVASRDVALNSEGVAKAVAAAQRRLGDTGRIVLRPSGTEAVIRLMVESEDAALTAACADDIADAILAIS